MSQPSTSSGPANHTITIPREPIQLDEVPPPKLPDTYLLRGTSREEYGMVGIPLYEAALRGDWKAAEPILKDWPDLVRHAITENYDTPLHIAASTESTKSVQNFVKNLLDSMSKEDLELQNQTYDTAFALAAQAGNIETAKTMVIKNSGLIDIPNKDGLMPLYMAALFEQPDMVRYLYGLSHKMEGGFWTDDNRGRVLQKCVEAEIFDVAIQIINDWPQVTHNKRLIQDILVALAEKTHAFKEKHPNVVLRIVKSFFARFHVKAASLEKENEALQLLRKIWGRIVQLKKREIDYIIQGPGEKVRKTVKEKESEVVPMLRKFLEDIVNGKTIPPTKIDKETDRVGYPSRVLFLATKAGNTRFIIELIRSNPDLIWKTDDKGRTIFHLAIKHRQINIYKLIYEIGAMKDLITPIEDKKGNNLLHMVGKKPKLNKIQNVSGAALEMQRELSWFKEVEQLIQPTYRKRKNNAGETPRMLFAREHAYLVSKGEDWMNNYMLVATLIATIVFAAAFTLPGGYDQETGIPFFSKKLSLIIFVISDAVSLISSSTSVLIFLSILTSRYAERDFQQSLPRRLLFGIATLFLSIVAMMVAFSASFFLLYHEKLKWMPITITCLAGLPVILFIKMQFQLLVDIFDFTYRSKYHFKPKKRSLYY